MSSTESLVIAIIYADCNIAIVFTVYKIYVTAILSFGICVCAFEFKRIVYPACFFALKISEGRRYLVSFMTTKREVYVIIYFALSTCSIVKFLWTGWCKNFAILRSFHTLVARENASGTFDS